LVPNQVRYQLRYGSTISLKAEHNQSGPNGQAQSFAFS